jgi:hypothetical protein
MTRRIAAAGVLAAMIGSAAPAHAQGGLSAAVLELARNAPPGVVRPISGERLYGAVVCARIFNGNTTTDDFAAQDSVAFTIVPRSAVTTPGVCPPSAGLQFLAPGNPDPSVGTRGQFEAWATANARSLFNILFPGSLSAALLGVDAAHLYGQQLLLTTVLGADAVRRSGAPARAGAAGLAELEWFNRNDSPGSSGTALQGLYDFTETLSVQGRYADHSEDLRTRALTVAADFHPYRELNRAVAVLRVGAVARSGVTYANASAANKAPLPSGATGVSSNQPRFGSIDFGGGGWASAFKDLGRTRIVGGALLQGSESHVPAAWLGDNFEYLADAINDRGLDFDLSWGGSVGYDLTNRTVLIGKYLESDNVKSGLESDPALPDLDLRKAASRTVIAGVAYRTGALRFSGGYRFASTGAISANAIFFRANADW